MKYTRLFAGDDGQSHFEEVTVALLNPENGNSTSAPIVVDKIILGEVEDGAEEMTWHNPSHRQYVIMLAGSMEIEVGDGSKRIFNPGDILLAEDMTGQGHITRAVTPGKQKYILIRL
jgi:hypothetical protein